MKKLFALVALCLATVSTSAQRETGMFSLQPKIGINVTTMSGLEPNFILDVSGKKFEGGNSLTAGFAAGIETEYQVAPIFSVAAGLLYSMQGTQYDDLETGTSNVKCGVKDNKLQLGYLNVPIVANLYVSKGFALKAGVQFGFLVYNKLKATYYCTNESDEKFHQSYNDAYKEEIEQGYVAKISNFDLSIPLGMSYEFDNHLVLDARYNLGLTKVTDEKFANKKSKNQVIQITLGYKFAL